MDEKNKVQDSKKTEDLLYDEEKSWAEEAKAEMEEFIEEQGIYIRQ